MKRYLLLLLILFPLVTKAGVFDFLLSGPSISLGDGNIGTLDKWTSTSSPSDSITQRTFGKPIKISGLSDGCLGLTNGLVTSTGSTCGAGSGGYPFTPTINFNVNNQATTGIAWFQNGLNASSTSNFDYASTTAISANTLCISTDCRTAWSTGVPYPFTPTTNFNVNNQATTGIPWFQNGFNASSTSHFVNASTTIFSSTASTFLSILSGSTFIGTTTGSASLNIGSLSATNVGLNIQGVKTQRGNILQIATSSGAVVGGYSVDRTNQANSDPGYWFLQPGNRKYTISTYDGQGAMRFGRSDATNALVFIPNSNEVQINAVTGRLAFYGSNYSNGEAGAIVFAPYTAGGTGLVQIGRRTSDSNPAVGASTEFWTNTGQTLPAIRVYGPGGVGDKMVVMASGNIGSGTSSPGTALGIVGDSYITGTETASYFKATSTITSNQFPYASSTAISATTICLTSDTCRTTWPTSGGGGGSYPFTPASNFNTNNQATTGIAWFQNGLNATSTSHFDYASSTGLSATTICIAVDCRTAWPSSGGGSYPFTVATNFGVNNQATTGIIWEQNGINASSTSHFDNASTTLLTATTAYITNLANLATGFVKVTSGVLSVDTNTYLTGNQSITLSGDVSGSGSTAITTAIGNNKVTVGMLAQAGANTILGNPTGATANAQYFATSSLFTNASATKDGLLTSVDYNTFNNKQPAGNYLTVSPFSASTNYAVTNQATTGIAWFQNGFNASSTSHVGSTTFDVSGSVGISTTTPGNGSIFGVHGKSIYDDVANFLGGIYIKIASVFSPSAEGEIGIDTTDNQLKFQSNSSTRVISPDITGGFTYATSTAWTGTTTLQLGPGFYAETWNRVKCYTNVGTLNVQFYNDSTSNKMNMFNASTTIGTVGFTTNNAISAGNKRLVDIGTPATSPTTISCTVSKTRDAS